MTCVHKQVISHPKVDPNPLQCCVKWSCHHLWSWMGITLTPTGDLCQHYPTRVLPLSVSPAHTDKRLAHFKSCNSRPKQCLGDVLCCVFSF